MTAETRFQNVTIVKGGQFMASEGAPPSDTPQAEKTLLDRPELRSAWDPQPRPPAETETAEYARRVTDPGWKWLYALVDDGNALREAERVAHARAVAAILAGAEAVCCVCGSGDVAYRNYRGQPFCWPCADGDTCPAPDDAPARSRPYVHFPHTTEAGTTVNVYVTGSPVPAAPGAEDVADECEGAPGEDPAPTSVIPAADEETTVVPAVTGDGGQQ